MRKYILGIKKEMSQVFDEKGKAIPVTLVKAGPMVVTQIKTKDKDGYEAVQVGFGKKKQKNIKKPQQGHLKKVKSQKSKIKSQNVRWLREFKADTSQYKVGDKIDVSVFTQGDKVEVSGVVKGRGFQGVVKRHGFAGGPRTHGQKHSERAPGSIGATGPQRVLKGKKMPGRMGGNKIKIKNLKVVGVDKENNILAISGALPGARNSLLEVVGHGEPKDIKAGKK